MKIKKLVILFKEIKFFLPLSDIFYLKKKRERAKRFKY